MTHRHKLLTMLLLLILAAPVFAQDEPSPYDIALQRIEEARESGATELDLSGLGLMELPPELWQLTDLQVLRLEFNQLSILPPEVGSLQNLRVLALYNNKLTSLPTEIEQLQNLTALQVDNNQIRTLPPEIGNLSQLIGLNLLWNHLTELPPEIGQLSRLGYLNLAQNQLENIPTQIGELHNLNILILSSNRITQLPSTIGSLTELCLLDVGNNNLQALPVSLGNIQKLLIPDGCNGFFPNSGFYFHNNPLTFPPPEIVEQGTPAILAFLRDEHERQQAEIKRLIVMSASGVGLIVAIMLGFRLRQQGRKSKKKRDE